MSALEDAVERLASLPQDVRRVLELVKDLDTRWTLSFAELKRQHSLYIDHVKKAVAGQPRDGSVDLAALVGDQKPWLERIAALKQEVSQLADDKVSLAQQVRRAGGAGCCCSAGAREEEQGGGRPCALTRRLGTDMLACRSPPSTGLRPRRVAPRAY
jgi:hypothetical protein